MTARESGKNGFGSFAVSYFKSRLGVLIAFLTFAVIFAAVFALYDLPLAAVGYPALLCAVVGIVALAADFARSYKKHTELTRGADISSLDADALPKPSSPEEEDLQKIIVGLLDERQQLSRDVRDKKDELTDYFTVWAHEIKTPLASMRLNLENEDSDFARMISLDHQRTEQYVDMAMAYLRFGSDSTDYVFRECALDPILRASIKKFRTQFIHKKLSVTYEPTDVRVVTDEKWLSFIVEQVLSNAVKYTREGGVTVRVEPPATVCISDTGIGISKDDLPRIFEKGYTGGNGRIDKRASGLGLYLCRRIGDAIGASVTAESKTGGGGGTTVRIDLYRERRTFE